MANRGLPTSQGNVGLSGSNFDAYVSSQRSYHNDIDWTAKLQEKYWQARQKFLAKVERKEDACVVLSDTKLDAKLQIYRSIDKSCARLTNILENYQNSLFVFANEENALGILLKECGKHDTTKAGEILTITGKSLTQSSHQRIRLYMPLLRLYQEMETFHSHAVEDTTATVDKLESRRAQYRASLMWMKDISEKLDPDTYKQLDRFRKVQAKVRDDKKIFDSTQMDVVQKIDLLMASRCNLMNQVLAPYQSILLETFERNYDNFKSAENIIKKEDLYEYEFKVLKQLNPLRMDNDTTTESPSKLDPINPKEKEVNLLIDEEPQSLEDKNNNIDSDQKSNVKLISDELGEGETENEEAKRRRNQLQAARANLDANLLDMFDDEKQVAKLLDVSESFMDQILPDTATNRSASVEKAQDAFDMLGDDGDFLAQMANMNKQYESDDLDPYKASTSKEQAKIDIDSDISTMGNLLGDLAETLDANNACRDKKAKREPTIDELLSNDLEDIDNSSYFKSLQGLQI